MYIFRQNKNNANIPEYEPLFAVVRSFRVLGAGAAGSRVASAGDSTDGRHESGWFGVDSTEHFSCGSEHGQHKYSSRRRLAGERAGFEFSCHAECFVDILRENPSHQAKLGIIGHFEDFFFGCEFADNRDWSKDLFCVNFRVWINISENCWLNIESLVTFSLFSSMILAIVKSNLITNSLSSYK